MKEYFKYKYGYINIDDENLYMTNSGKWQEARETEEKSRANEAVNERRINYMKSFVFIVFGGIVIYFAQTIDNKKVSIGIVVAALAIGYKLYDYFSSEFGSRYRIPLHKLESVTAQGTERIRIGFLNANGNPDFEMIDGLEPKGREFLLALKK
ncbi:hypothetical protein ACLI1A_10560 [Flavobacterium sp. RHBU_3]|uniref:hypothetical protein n=1 Tax=Flavobacterium sp. RHBU_3 TaxID=3391184 RepID=UPI003984C594